MEKDYWTGQWTYLPGIQNRLHPERPEVDQSSIETNDLGKIHGIQWDHGIQMGTNIYLCFRVRDAIWGGAGIQDSGTFSSDRGSPEWAENLVFVTEN